MRTRIASLALVSALLAACGGVGEAVFGPDTGGWAKDWNATTCEEYLAKMTERERTAFSQFTLRILREGTLETAPEAPEAMVTRFSAAISSFCREPDTGADYPITAASAVVYVTDKQYEPPYR